MLEVDLTPSQRQGFSTAHASSYEEPIEGSEGMCLDRGEELADFRSRPDAHLGSLQSRRIRVRGGTAFELPPPHGVG
jgi:hypothetical protein